MDFLLRKAIDVRDAAVNGRIPDASPNILIQKRLLALTLALLLSSVKRVHGRFHTGLRILQAATDATTDLKAQGNLLMLADIRPVPIEEFEKTGLLDIIGRENVFPAKPGLGEALDDAQAAAEAWIAAQATRSTTDEGSGTSE